MLFYISNNKYFRKIEDDGTDKRIEWSQRGDNPPADLPENSVFAQWNSTTLVGDLEKLINDKSKNSSFDSAFITPYITWFDSRYIQVKADEDAATIARMRDWDIFRTTARERFLKDSDWTQATDAPLDAATKTAWSTYRTAIRNIPETYAAEDLLYLRFQRDGSFIRCTQVNSENLAPEGTVTVLIQSPSDIFSKPGENLPS